MSTVLESIAQMLQKGKRKDVAKLCQQAIDEGLEPNVILTDGLLAGMDVVGAKFKANEIFVPQVLVSARAMKAGSEVLKPYLSEENATAKGKVVIGTVQGDLHDIGKNLVAMMFEGKGFDVVDLGVDVSPEKFIQSAIEEDADIIGMSALLTTTMPMMGEVVKEAKKAGIRDKVKIMVGGAPVTQEFADSIGADAYTQDAPSAAEKAVEFVTAS